MFVLLSERVTALESVERVKVRLAHLILIDEKFTGNFHRITSSSVGLRIANSQESSYDAGDSQGTSRRSLRED